MPISRALKSTRSPEVGSMRKSRLPENLQGPTGLDFATPNGGIATELIHTVEIDGKYYNVPLLVPTQIDVNNLLSGKPISDEQSQIAIDWTFKNQNPVPFDSLDDALKAEQARHKQLERY